MAGKKPRSKRSKRKGSSLLSRLIWGVWLFATGGGVAGWAAPDLPIVGPLVQRIIHHEAAAPQGSPSGPATVEDQFAQLHRRGSGSATDGTAAIPAAGATHDQPASATTRLASSRKPSDTILIASFNIQVFGTSKLGKAWIVNILSQIVRQFDVVAIQEVRSKDDRILPEFVTAINADGSQYSYLIGPRLGRTVSTEQYAFVYDTDRIEIDRSSIGTVQDPRDQLHREPFVARFRARTATPSRSFTFWLVNTHTDPDEVATEVDALADVFQVMQRARSDEDDVILLGDLNASDQQFGRLRQIPSITWAVHGTTTNTRHTKMYDNLLFDRNCTAEYTGRWGIVDLESTFHLTREQALQVSDHLPVWAEFHIEETAAAANTARLSRLLGR